MQNQERWNVLVFLDMSNGRQILLPHARFCEALKEKMDELNIRCIVNAGGQVLGGAYFTD